jgi:hypothetical protein
VLCLGVARGKDDVALPQSFEQEFAGGSGKIRQTVPGTNEGGRGHADGN